MFPLNGWKMSLLLLLLLLLSFDSMIFSHLNLYRSDRSENSLRFEFDCLSYRIRREKLAYQHLSNIVEDLIPYCFRPLNENNSLWTNSFVDQRFSNWTFEELNWNNITTNDLLHWSASIDLMEDYEDYLLRRNSSSLSKKIFCNCSENRFGDRCQYSFEFSDELNVDEIVGNEFDQKSLDLNDSLEMSCYIFLVCDRGNEKNFCLDWREICDGRIDCFNDGIDEMNCLEMEMNECAENEYRCHNGLCIPMEFWNDDRDDPHCLDRSNERNDHFYLNQCYQDPSFRCEEHSCPINWHQFSCSDGECVQKFDRCHNGRDQLLIKSFSSHNDRLNGNCSILMNCLTMLKKEVNGISCRKWFEINSFAEYLQTCDSIIEFPSIPIHNGHLRLLYEKASLSVSSLNSYFYPDYICFNESLCDCFEGNYFYGNFRCLSTNFFQFHLSISGDRWIDLILELDSHFSSCLLPYHLQNSSLVNSSSFYFCENSSKFLSKHRIMDEISDCYLHDDENGPLSCSLNDRYRIECFHSNICLSSIHRDEDCPENARNDDEKEIVFQSFCNGLEEFSFEDENNFLFTDESECEFWPCRNIYSRCDGFWTCPNGEDEENCFDSQCPQGRFQCLSMENSSLICLSSSAMNDGIDHCLGGFDELQYCRRLYPLKQDFPRFHCSNSDLCLSVGDLCNEIRTCPHGDDENFCEYQRFICDEKNQTMKEKILCQLSEFQRKNPIHFSLETTAIYPLISPRDEIDHFNGNEFSLVSNFSPMNKSHSRWSWFCHRGLTIRHWIGENEFEMECLCPPSYFGNRCQFQNQRVSLTLEIVNGEKSGVYTVILMLINEDEEKVESFDQFDYSPAESCSMKFNRYLLFSTRPKNISEKYFLRIDIYEKNPMKFSSSWFVEIPFLFLPVNRISSRLILRHSPRLSLKSACPLKCFFGQCEKYENIDKYFCQCFSGWSGIRCDRSIDCSPCSIDSICVGTIDSQRLCLCPLNQFGNRCLLKFSCPLNSCENRGQCISMDKHFLCLCDEPFFGSRCQFRKVKVDIFFDLRQIPRYLRAYFLSISVDSRPKWTMMIEKLTLFQRQVTFRLSIDYHLVLLKLNEDFYLSVVQNRSHEDLSTSIDESRRCFSVEELFNLTILSRHRYRRVKYFHRLCEENLQLKCFYDEKFFCLCTNDHQSNCVDFVDRELIRCSSNGNVCLNGGECFQDHRHCSSSIHCICSQCFFGDRCQFYAKDFGLTLDQILGYEIQENLSLFRQRFSVQLSFVLTLILFLLALINGICSILTFRQRICQEVGCGIYLLASSITSLLTMILFTLKFFFLIFSSTDFIGRRVIVYSNCIFIEPMMKYFLNLDHWFNGCVAMERALTVYRGISFQKKKSVRLAKRMVILLIVMNLILILPHLSSLYLYDDRKEDRTWCVVHYSSSLQFYNTFLICFQFFTPFFLNLSSASFIIIRTAQQRIGREKNLSYFQELKKKFSQHKHLLISPISLILLSLPRLIISFTLNCQKSSKYFWFHLSGYFISFFPSTFVFVVFVLPSPIFQKAFQQILSKKILRFSAKRKFIF